MPGTVTLEAEVANISRHGFWLYLGDRELFLPFEEFPWFKGASIDGILKVERPQEHHLYWPDLGVDLSVESIEHPERFQLTARASAQPDIEGPTEGVIPFEEELGSPVVADRACGNTSARAEVVAPVLDAPKQPTA